jgi:hypothetical protein
MAAGSQGFRIATRGSDCSRHATTLRSIYSALAVIVSSICLLPICPRIAHSEVDRIALVLAVEEYSHFTNSAVTADTGQKIGDAFKKRGFDVTVVKNPSDATARASLRDFAQKATGANAAIVVLSGHGVSFGGRSYFLPSNSEITRDSDLLSRGLAIPSVSGIVARAKFGGVFFFMTVANIPSTMQSVSARPSFPGSLEKNVVVVFSTSDKIPVSRVDKVTQQAAADFVDGINADPLKVTNLVNAGSAGGLGQVLGNVPDLDLSKAPTPPPPPPVAAAKGGAPAIEAEKRAREAEERATQSEAKAKEAEERARAQTQEAEARAREAESRAFEAEQKAGAKAEDARAAEAASSARESQPAPPPNSVAPADIKSLTTVEELFGNAQRMRIQGELKKRGLYKGEIDAIFGDLTREAIREYQKSRGDDVTGYLTPQQLQSLVGG